MNYRLDCSCPVISLPMLPAGTSVRISTALLPLSPFSFVRQQESKFCQHDVCVVRWSFDINSLLCPLWALWHETCAAMTQSVQRLTGRPGDRIPLRGEIFRSRPNRSWWPPSLLYNGNRVSLPRIKRPGRGVDHSPPSSAEVEEKAKLYLYSLSEHSWIETGWPLP